jgi:hypothetical protein
MTGGDELAGGSRVPIWGCFFCFGLLFPFLRHFGDFSPNPYWKNMISTYGKDFPSKKSPKFARFRKINSTNRQIIIIRSTK